MTTTDHDTPVERVTDAAILEYQDLADRLPAAPWCCAHKPSGHSGQWQRWIGKPGAGEHVLQLAPSPGYRDISDIESFVLASRTIGPALAEEVLELRRIRAVQHTVFYDLSRDLADNGQAELANVVLSLLLVEHADVDAQEGHADATRS